jgi:RNA polymerase sigma factor (sigma-70 family)
MIDIVSVGNQKLAYQDHNNVEFESLSFYLELAKKAIAKFGKNFSSNISKEMLKSEDAIANVANCIMMADWRWDKDRKGDSGLQKTKYSYRNQCAIWAIKSYVSRKKNKKCKSGIEINGLSDDKEYCLLDILCQDNCDPIDNLIEKETKTNIKEYLDKILSHENNLLTSRQCEYIKLYYFEGLTFAQIGKKFNITREAVRQGIKKAISKIKELGCVNV